MSASFTVEDHRHCVFCGQVVRPEDVKSECKSPNNTMLKDEQGKRYHATLK